MWFTIQMEFQRDSLRTSIFSQQYRFLVRLNLLNWTTTTADISICTFTVEIAETKLLSKYRVIQESLSELIIRDSIKLQRYSEENQICF